MIFRNKDAANSSIFGDSKQEETKAPAADDSFLESMRRKAWSEPSKGGDGIRNSINRASSSSDDASRSGRAFLGMHSARSIFDNSTSLEKSADSRLISDIKKIEDKAIRSAQENERRSVSNPAGEEFKASSSMHAKEHGRIGTSARSVSIFDAKPFERLSDKKVDLKKDQVASSEKTASLSAGRQMTSNSVFEKSFDSLSQSEKKDTVHQSSVDRIWNALKGKDNG